MTSHERRSDPEGLTERGNRTDRPDRGDAPRGYRAGGPRERCSAEALRASMVRNVSNSGLTPLYFQKSKISVNLLILWRKISSDGALRSPLVIAENSFQSFDDDYPCGGHHRPQKREYRDFN
jgi:hypothetical protein